MRSCEMILISHRGNINGINEKRENYPVHIMNVINQGYDVEIDVWKIKDEWFLGHDEPQYLVDIRFLQNPHLWCHAKNLQALQSMLEYDINCFWHQDDDFTITSKGDIWTYPGMQVCESSIIVCKDKADTFKMAKQNIKGICSDYVELIK